jgi:hypothetical protein
MRGVAMTDDITHNLTVVREALEAEGLGVHVKLIDAAIEEISGLREANHHYRDSAARDEKEIASLRDRLASARKALEPFAAKFDAVDALYRKRGGNPDVFKDAHPSFDVKAEELRIGVWRAAKAALTDDKGNS